MEQNQANALVNQLKGMLSFLTPQITFIANAAFAVIVFLFFLLSGFLGESSISHATVLFKTFGGILAFLVLIGLVLGAVLMPMKSGKLCANTNMFIAGFVALTMLSAPMNALGIFALIFSILWIAFTAIKKGDEVKL